MLNGIIKSIDQFWYGISQYNITNGEAIQLIVYTVGLLIIIYLMNLRG